MPTQITQESLGLLISKNNPYNSTGSGHFLQSKGIQSFNYSIDSFNNSFDYLGSLRTLHYNTPPNINLNYSYNLTNGNEEYNFGISGISGIVNLYDKEHNVHFVVGRQYYDLNLENSLSGFYIVTFGNSALTNYNIQGQINSFIQANVSFSALNFNIQQYNSGIYNAAINKQNGIENSGFIQLPILNTGFGTGISSLLTNNVIVTVDTGLLIGSSLDGQSSILTSFNVGIDLGRAIIRKMGWKYPNKRCLRFPTTLTINFDANFAGYQNDSAQNLNCADDRLHNVTFQFYDNCRTREILRYEFSGLRLTSQNSSVGVNQRKTISYNFERELLPQDSFNFTKFIS